MIPYFLEKWTLAVVYSLHCQIQNDIQGTDEWTKRKTQTISSMEQYRQLRPSALFLVWPDWYTYSFWKWEKRRERFCSSLSKYSETVIMIHGFLRVDITTKYVLKDLKTSIFYLGCHIELILKLGYINIYQNKKNVEIRNNLFW